MTDIWEKIKEQTDKHSYMEGIDRDRLRVKQTHEIFTPSDTSIMMMQMLLESNPDVFAPGKSVLDPACGDGQLLVPVKWYKVYAHGMTEDEACKDLYGVDIMRDNVEMTKSRLGGGNIIMGNTLNPGEILEGQTPEERKLCEEWFGEDNLDEFFA